MDRGRAAVAARPAGGGEGGGQVPHSGHPEGDGEEGPCRAGKKKISFNSNNNNNNNNIVLVKTSGYGKYLGKLKVNFDERTWDVKSFSGNPVLLDGTVPKDEELEKSVRRYAKQVCACRVK